jgi:type I thyroxine 5'-deiodinase
MYERHKSDVEFFVVYIGEAHPSDAWQLKSNVKDQVVYASPNNDDERSNLAGLCVTRLGIKIPAVVDRFDDSTDKAYSGWPDRLYLIDRDGRIAFKSKPGPFGFKPDDLEAAIKARR